MRPGEYLNTADSNTIAKRKEVCRQALRRSRAAMMASDIGHKSEAACKRALPLLEGLNCVAIYSAKGSELPVHFLATMLGKGVVAYPRVMSDNPVLDFCVLGLAQNLVKGKFDLMEPPSSCLAVDGDTIDAFVIPGLGFSPKGERMGWGKGYYDHTLAKHPHALRVGICYQEQVQDLIPTDNHDQCLDWVVTDINTYRGQRCDDDCPENTP